MAITRLAAVGVCVMTEGERILDMLTDISIRLVNIETYLGELFEDKLHPQRVVNTEERPIPQKFWP